jgi:protein-L-isoaspartate O-methyltransferase
MIEEKSKPYGVSQQVIHDGDGSLSLEQRALYDTVIVTALRKHEEKIEMIRIMKSKPD